MHLNKPPNSRLKPPDSKTYLRREKGQQKQNKQANNKDMKNDIWLIIATCEECGLHHRTNAGEIANKVIKMLGLRNLSKYFGIDKTEVSNRITQYIYTHEF